MAGQLENLILQGLHEKAAEVEMDLNDFEQFKKFAAKVDDVVNQASHTIKHIVKSTSCGCGKQKTSVGEIPPVENTYGDKPKPTEPSGPPIVVREMADGNIIYPENSRPIPVDEAFATPPIPPVTTRVLKPQERLETDPVPRKD